MTISKYSSGDMSPDDGPPSALTLRNHPSVKGLSETRPGSVTADSLTSTTSPETGDVNSLDDGDPCTIDVCNEATGQVTHTPMDCGDGDDCTLDECVEGICVNTPFWEIPCDDNGDCPPESTGCDGSWCICPGEPAAAFELQPVESTGPFEIVDREIIIPSGGVRVTLDLLISDWDRNHDGDPTVVAYQSTIDRESFTSGSSGLLSLAEIPCETSEDCGPHSVCEPDDTCDLYAAMDIQQDNPDWIYFGFTAIAATTPYHAEHLAWGAAVLFPDEGASDTGAKKYGGTMILDVSPDASGTFTVSFDPGMDYCFMYAPERLKILPLTLRPAYITISGN